MRLFQTVLGAIALSACLLSPAAAQTGLTFEITATNPTAPVEVESDALDVDRETGVAVFTGSVTVIQDKIKLTADRVEITYNESAKQVELVNATGHVIYVSPSEEAEGERGTYAPLDGILRLSGNVLVVQESTAISGDRLNANLKTGEAEIEGRVRSIFGTD